jgi:hypothetical protein
MSAASFRALCMDAADAIALARFWAEVLEAPLVDLGDGSARIDPRPGRPAGETVWVNPVPEPRTVKTRVHLDLRLAEPGPARLLALGARVVREPGEDKWWVLADPEGNEFCAFPPAAGGAEPAGVFELVVDCTDPVTQANWWSAVVGGTVHRSPHGSWTWVEGAEGFPWQYWVFNPVPEPKVVKNRVHWDVDLTGKDPEALLRAGARILREPDTEIHWWIMADPEGNEFCAFAPEQ